jgi:hypothetical protein
LTISYNRGMDSPAPRRRFQFRLWTLMIAVTLLAAACGYAHRQAEMIRERHDAVETHESRTSWEISGARSRYRHQAPWPLRWLGEKGFAAIYVNENERDDEIENLKRLFPEAEICRDGTCLSSPLP